MGEAWHFISFSAALSLSLSFSVAPLLSHAILRFSPAFFIFEEGHGLEPFIILCSIGPARADAADIGATFPAGAYVCIY